MKNFWCRKAAVQTVLLVGVSSSLMAEEALKMGFVNYEDAVAQELQAQKEIKDLQKKDQEINDASKKASDEFEKKYAEFTKAMETMNEKAREDKRKAFMNEYNALDQQFKKRRLDLEKDRQDLLQKLEGQNRFLLDNLARKEGYTMVFNAQALVYASDKLKAHDLTPKLIAEYNKTHPVQAETPKKAGTKAPAKKK